MFGGGRARTKKEARAHQDVESPAARHVAAVQESCAHEKTDKHAERRCWSVPRAIDEATAYLERYLLNCWQLLRNSHLSQYFPAIVIFRLVLRGVYVLLLAPLKKCDDSMYRWECAQRENMYEHEPSSSIGKLVYAVFVDRDGWASAFYADMLLEIIFMAAVCGANNASVKQRNRCQLRRWHWLVAAAASLFVAVARDARLTYWDYQRPLDATAKSRSIVHVIGCAIILICDALLVAVLAYALVIAVAFAPHDVNEQLKRVEATRDRLAREKDPVERAVLEKALARDEALLADLKAEAPGALPRAWRPRADAWRALLRGTLRDPTWAPSHLYKEAEQRALLAALIHPPGACPGPFGGHDLAERAHDPTRRPRAPRRAEAIADDAYADFVRRSGSSGDDDRSFRVEKRTRRVQLYSRRLAFECCTNSLCGALFKAQAEDIRETRLDRLHLPEGAETAWEDRVRDRSYHPAARLIAAVAAAWLMAVTVIAALAYLTWLVATTVERRLGNLEDDLDDVDSLLAAYHNTSCSSFDRLTNASCAQVAQYDAVAGVASAASILDAALNATGLGADVAQDVSRLTDAAQVLAVEMERAQNMTRQYVPYLLEYRTELGKWTAAAARYCSMLTDAGNVAAVAAFVFVNYGLLMILFRFEEATLEMRETGLLDGRDLIKAEATLPRTLGDRLWRGFITPAAPYAIRFMGVVVAHALVVSAICFLGAGLVVFAWNAWKAQEAARRYVVELLGGAIVPLLVLWLFNMLLFVFLNKFISDGTYVHHRNCFDLWDFVLGMWDLIVGPVAGPLRVLVLYLIATINVFRVDVSLFTGNIGWLDPGYNTFASTVMLSERHNNPVMCAASRLILSAVEDAYARRVRPAHCLAFAAPAPSRALACRLQSNELARILDEVLLGGRVPSSLKRGELADAWRALHLIYVLTLHPSLEPYNVAAWRARPISGSLWRRAYPRLKARKEREATKLRRKVREAVADHELRGAPMRAAFLGHVDELEEILEMEATAPSPVAESHASSKKGAWRHAAERALKHRRPATPTQEKTVVLDADAIQDPEHLVDVALPFQLGHLRTAFRLLDKDQDGLVSVDDLRFHYQSQGCEISRDEALMIVDAISCARKGYYALVDDDLREISVEPGFDLPEFVAFCVWRLASEEPAACSSNIGSGLGLDGETRRALSETLFVRMKGFDERVADVSAQVASTLSFHQFWEHVVKRTKLHKGPFGARRQTARLQFELLAQGARGAALSMGVEGAISSGCGAAFASHDSPGADGASFSNVAAFFGATCCRVGAEDDDAAFEQDSDGDGPADERVEVDLDDDDDDLPPWTAGDAEVMRGALDALDGDERALCAPGLWMRHGDEARSAAVRAVIEAKPAIAAAIDAGDPHAVTDAVAALLRERAPLATLGRRQAFIRAATEPSPSRGVAGQRHHLVILLGELPPFHREVLTRLAKHLGKIVRRRRLNGASWRGLAAATAPLIFGHGVAADADEALWATVACARLLRTVNAAAGGPKSPTPSPPTSPASTAAASPVSPSPSPRNPSPVAHLPEPPATPATSPSPVATPVATPRSIEPSPPEPAATPPSPEPVATPPKPKPAPIAPPEPAPTPATVTPSRGERTCVVVRAFVATSPNELSVNEGDVVLVPAADLAKFGSLVYARKTDGSDREGYVPHKFVREGSRR